MQHPAVAEAAVVGKPHEITGQAVCCFVTLKKGDWDHEQLGKELRQWVAHEIGSFARPEEIRFTDALPKTRSGKIMRASAARDRDRQHRHRRRDHARRSERRDASWPRSTTKTDVGQVANLVAQPRPIANRPPGFWEGPKLSLRKRQSRAMLV